MKICQSTSALLFYAVALLTFLGAANASQYPVHPYCRSYCADRPGYGYVRALTSPRLIPAARPNSGARADSVALGEGDVEVDALNRNKRQKRRRRNRSRRRNNRRNNRRRNRRNRRSRRSRRNNRRNNRRRNSYRNRNRRRRRRRLCRSCLCRCMRRHRGGTSDSGPYYDDDYYYPPAGAAPYYPPYYPQGTVAPAMTTPVVATLPVPTTPVVATLPALTTTAAAATAPNSYHPGPNGLCVLCAQENAVLVNAHRQRAGLPPLVWNARLAQLAAMHTRQMFVEDRLYHSSYQGIWENVAMSYAPGSKFSASAQLFFNMWRNSAGHNANMLESRVRCIGVAIVGDKATGRMYATQIFTSSC